MTPPRFISTASWAKRNVQLDGKPFDPDEHPQFIEPMATIDRRPGCVFILRFPPQTGKSRAMQLRVARNIAVTPNRALWYCKTGKDVEDFSNEKLKRLLEGTPLITAKFPYDNDKRGRKTLFLFVDAPLTLLGGDVPAHRNQRSGHDLYLDETWQYEPGAIAEIHKRSLDYEKTRRIIHGETGPNEGTESDTWWKESSQRTWHCVCTLCNKPIELIFGDKKSQDGFKWDTIKGKDGLWDVGSASKTVRFVCPACKGIIPWSTGIQKKLNDPARGAQYFPKNGDPNPKVEGWTANAFAFREWPGIVAEWLKACNAEKLGDLSLREEFVKKQLVETWSESSVHKDSTELPILPYKMGEEWADEGFFPNSKQRMRFVTIDVQQMCFWGVCRKWAYDGRSRLHAFRQIWSPHEVKSFCEECGVTPADVFVDSAYDPKPNGNFWGRATKLCADYGYWATNAIAVKSFLHKDNIRRMYSPPDSIDAWQGEALRGQKPRVDVIKYYAHGAKNMVDALRKAKHSGTGEWMHSIPVDAPKQYIEQAWAEKLRRKKLPNGGFAWEWYNAHPQGDNHAFDLEGAQVICAMINNLVGQSAVESPEPEKPKE